MVDLLSYFLWDDASGELIWGSKHATRGALAKYVMVVRALAGCVVVRWVVGSILHGGLIELFLVG